MAAPAADLTATPPDTGPDDDRPTMGRKTSTTNPSTIQTPHRSLRSGLPLLRPHDSPRPTLGCGPPRSTRQRRRRMGFSQPQTSTRQLQPPRRPETRHEKPTPTTQTPTTTQAPRLLTGSYAIPTQSDTLPRPHTASPSHSAELSHKKWADIGRRVVWVLKPTSRGLLRERDWGQCGAGCPWVVVKDVVGVGDGPHLGVGAARHWWVGVVRSSRRFGWGYCLQPVTDHRLPSRRRSCGCRHRRWRCCR